MLVRFLKKIYRFVFIRKVRYFPRSPDIVVAGDFKMGKYKQVIAGAGAKINIGNEVSFREFCSIIVHNNQSLNIGDHVFFNNYCSLNCLGDISIGDNTFFGEGVKLYDHNHEYRYNDKKELLIEPQKFKIGSVVIGKNCWIASNVTILTNVVIGDNVIIGANCLVHKSVPSNSIMRSVSTTETRNS